MGRWAIGAAGCTLAGVVAAGCGQSAGAAPQASTFDAAPQEVAPQDVAGEEVAPPQVAPLAIAGRWGMRQAYADSIAVELVQDGGVLTGTMCSAGLPTDPDDPLQRHLCGPIVDGRVDGRHVHFGARLSPGVVTVDAEVSADGTRIAGQYVVAGRTQQTAWWRLASDGTWVDPNESWPSDLLPFSCGDPAYNPGYELTLVDGPAGSSEFTRDRSYLLVFCAGVAGDLGAFGGPDLHVTSAGGHTVTIVAGPVPETTATLPTGLTLDFDTGVLRAVRARTPSGATYSFSAARSPGGAL